MQGLNIFIVVGGLTLVGYFIYRVDRGVAKEEQNIIDNLKPPGSQGLYQPCLRTSECMGGTTIGTIGATSICQQGQCLPLVTRDTLFRERVSPVDLGLKKACGKFYLQGQGVACDNVAQCGTNLLTTEATDSSNSSATVSSKVFCGEGKCRAKGKDWAGIYWDAYPHHPEDRKKYTWTEEELSGRKINQNGHFVQELMKKCPDAKFLL